MENFVVSARKYRPDSFENVVGQPSITRTLKNAISSGQLAHAYLFCGPRGVGKTTCARIFAKTINCQEPGPEGEACDNCESCISFRDNRSFNIHELDAASNNSVDDIKTLIDKIMIPPQVGKYSTYIIDEVHMLSQQAFNAFLKTLEEPPTYAIFILATTEKQKILPTILSRCQIFDFKRITVREMMVYLAGVAEKEGVQIDNTSLNIIAQKADGSMRDALSIFDQVVSFSGKVVDYKAIIENLNVLDYEYYFRMTQAFLESDYSRALTIFDEILESGFDGRNYLGGLGKHFRNLLMCKDEETIKLLELSGEIAEKYRSYSRECSIDFLFATLKILSYTDINYKQAKDTRLHVEISLLKLSSILATPGIQEQPVVVKQETEKKDNSKADPGESAKKDTVDSPKTEAEASSTPDADAVEPDKSNNVQTDEKDTVETDAGESKEEAPEQESVENKVEEAEVEVSKTVISSTPIKTGPRIIDFMNGAASTDQEAESKEEEPVQEESSVLELNQENLNVLWIRFADDIKEDQPRLYNTLTTQKPTLDESNIIRLGLNNPLQEKAMASIHSEILAFIKKNTGVQDLSLETKVPQEKAEKKLYTADEKFKHMQEQNPQLGLFKSTFNLDFE